MSRKLTGNIVVGFLATTLLAIFAGNVVPAWAEASLSGDTKTTLTVVGQTIVLEPNDPSASSDTVEFRVSGDTPQTITVELMDVVIDSSGTRVMLPPGSTTNTLEGVAKVGSYPRTYLPTGKTQRFTVDVTARDPGDTVRFGGVRVSVAPLVTQTSGSSVANVSSVLLTVIVVPEGFSGNLPRAGESALTTSGLSVRQHEAENFFETLIPDIPGIVNRGPVSVSVEAVNESDSPAFIATTWSLTSGGEILMTSRTERALVFARQSVSDQIVTVAAAPGATRPIDVLPSFGFVSVDMNAVATLGQGVLGSSGESASFLVLRWKEPFAFLLAGGAIWLLMWRSRGRGKSADATALVTSLGTDRDPGHAVDKNSE